MYESKESFTEFVGECRAATIATECWNTNGKHGERSKGLGHQTLFGTLWTRHGHRNGKIRASVQPGIFRAVPVVVLRFFSVLVFPRSTGISRVVPVQKLRFFPVQPENMRAVSPVIQNLFMSFKSIIKSIQCFNLPPPPV